MRTDVYYQRGAADPVLDEDAVLELVRRYAPGARALTRVDERGDLTERLRLRARRRIEKIAGAGSPRAEDALGRVDLELSRCGDPGGFVALHTNPAVTHTFVDAGTGAFTGLIDFGDAYIGHPIFDLWYWGPAEKEPLLAGYTVDAPVSEACMAVFRAAGAIDALVDALSAECGGKKTEYGWE